jgi:chemotaxis protein CheD
MTTRKLLTVGISECLLSRDPEAILATHALGSCIAVTIHDPVTQVAGLLHFMLPDSTMDPAKAQLRPFMFADTGVPLLFRQAYELGAVKQRLITSVLGGAQVLDSNDTFNIGKRNYLALRKIFWKAGVMVHHEDVGGTTPRSVRMEVGSGRIVISYGRMEKEISPGMHRQERSQ